MAIPSRNFFISVSTIVLVAYACGPPSYYCPVCTSVELQVDYPSDTIRLDSVLYIEEDVRVWEGRYNQQTQVWQWQLPLNELEDSSTFVVFSSHSAPDTLRFTYKFRPDFSENCDLNYLKLWELDMTKCTFPRSELYVPLKTFECPVLEVSY